MSSPSPNRSSRNRAGPSNTNGMISGYDYDADNDESSPDARQRRQDLRDTSYDDSPNSSGGYGAIGPSSTHRFALGNDFAGEGGPVQVNGIASQEPEDYGIPVASSSTQVHVTTTTISAPILLPSALPPVFTMAPHPVFPAHSAPVQALLAAGCTHSSQDPKVQFMLTLKGPLNVDMTVERECPDANANFPAFLQGIWVVPTTQFEWFNIVLPFILGFTFTFNSTSDLYFGAQMFGSSQLPRLHQFVTRLNFPGFYWFSGVAHNRRHNPHWQMMASLNAVQELSFSMHTAGVTTSAFGERDMIALERVDPIASAERVPLPLQQVVEHYEMHGVFTCTSLQYVRIEYIDDTTIRANTRGNPVHVLFELQQYLIFGFRSRGMDVVVEIVRVS